MEFSVFEKFQVPWNFNDIILQGRQQSVTSIPSSTCEVDNRDTINKNENNTDSHQDQTSLDTKIYPTENTQRKPLQIHGLPPLDIVIAQILNRPIALGVEFLDVLWVEKSPVEKECVKLQHQKTIETKNQWTWKQDWHAINCDKNWINLKR